MEGISRTLPEKRREMLIEGDVMNNENAPAEMRLLIRSIGSISDKETRKQMTALVLPYIMEQEFEPQTLQTISDIAWQAHSIELTEVERKQIKTEGGNPDSVQNQRKARFLMSALGKVFPNPE